ncbi:hypothetical protein K4L44_00300 [Halosquirtibacter laminarini]|uniref:Uncharacterized protein n=1 Tax=Halosquirtibacter laminarini TaxID=3374600 RepID=A0AC61NFI1_9BACT|nr:hypothetical protein K4L44_00300 [Prolixibacteraceae bacterium]
MPTAYTQELARRSGLYFKQILNGIAVFYDCIEEKTLLCNLWDETLYSLKFILKCEDRFFMNYTDVEKAIVRKYVSMPNHKDGFILPIFYFETPSRAQEYKLTYQEMVNSHFVVGVSIKKEILEANVNEKKYTIEFESRSTIWEYNIMTDQEYSNLIIKEENDKIKFSKTIKSDHGFIIKSEQPILLKQYHDYTFTLLDDEQEVLIQNLEMPNNRMLSRDEVPENYKSQIFIYV